MELPHPAFLGALIPEHGACIEELQWQALRQPIGNHRPHNTSGIFRPQCQRLATPIGKIVGFLGHHVAAVTKRSREHLGKFENRRGHFLKPVKARRVARRIHDAPMRRHYRWQQV